MPKLKDLISELELIQQKLNDVEISMGKADSVLELQLLEVEENKLMEIYQKKNADLLRKKQKLRKKEFVTGRQTGKLGDEILRYSRSIKLWGDTKSNLTLHEDLKENDPNILEALRIDEEFSDSDSSSDSETQRKDEEKSAELQRWKIVDEDLKIDYNRCLGKGSFGAVYLGSCRGTTVAVKVLDGDVNEEALEDFKNEVSVMSKLRHANLLLFMGLNTSEGKLKLVMEYASRGSLHDLLREKPGVDFKRKMLVAKHTALGVFWLHQSKILHLDLKPANIFIDENWVTKVADFGLSQLKDDIQFAGGTLHYMAPEVLLGEDFDEKADVYSFGLVLWEFMSETVPWNTVLVKFEDFKEHVAIRQERPKMPPNVPHRLVSLIESCWNQNPKVRPTIKQIVECNIFDHLIIEYVIHDKLGQEFWKMYFFGRYEIKWSRFVKGFARFLGISLTDDSEKLDEFIALKLSLEARDNIVTIESFSYALSWHGPLTRGRNFIISVLHTWSSLPGFHGHITSKEAEQLLAPSKIKESTFLIRFSSTPGDYVVSYKAKKSKDKSKFVHYKILHQPGAAYKFDNKDFESIEACLKVMKKNVKYPLPGNKFSQIKEHNKLNPDGASSYKAQL